MFAIGSWGEEIKWLGHCKEENRTNITPNVLLKAIGTSHQPCDLPGDNITRPVMS